MQPKAGKQSLSSAVLFVGVMGSSKCFHTAVITYSRSARVHTHAVFSAVWKPVGWSGVRTLLGTVKQWPILTHTLTQTAFNTDLRSALVQGARFLSVRPVFAAAASLLSVCHLYFLHIFQRDTHTMKRRPGRWSEPRPSRSAARGNDSIGASFRHLKHSFSPLAVGETAICIPSSTNCQHFCDRRPRDVIPGRSRPHTLQLLCSNSSSLHGTVAFQHLAENPPRAPEGQSRSPPSFPGRNQDVLVGRSLISTVSASLQTFLLRFGHLLIVESLRCDWWTQTRSLS